MNANPNILYRGGEGEITVKKSRFIAMAQPVKTEEEAEAFLDDIRKTYRDARHHCYAWVTGENGLNTRCSDDGEPSQTAGKPILDVILNAGLTDALIVVTRYFGGTLLGTGGLCRAYTEAAKKALDASVILEKYMGERWVVETDYTDLGKLKYLAAQNGFYILDTEYAQNINLTLLIPAEAAPLAAVKIAEKTSAKARIHRKDTLPYVISDKGPVLFETEALAIRDE